MTTYTFHMLDTGKLPEGVKQTLANLFPCFAGKKVRLTVEEAKDRRSIGQNDYYWAVIVPFVRKVRAENGDPVSLEECHEDLLTEFAPVVSKKKLFGASYTRPMRTKEMNVEQMSKYITAITARMAQFGNPVPVREEA